jgi:hypothetical protein
MLEEYPNVTVEMDDASWLLHKLSKIFLENEWVHRHPVRVNTRFNNLVIISHRIEKSDYALSKIIETLFESFPPWVATGGCTAAKFGPINVQLVAEVPTYNTLRMYLEIRSQAEERLFKGIEDYLRYHATFNDIPESSNFLEAGVPLELFITEFLTPVSWGIKVFA